MIVICDTDPSLAMAMKYVKFFLVIPINNNNFDCWIYPIYVLDIPTPRVESIHFSRDMNCVRIGKARYHANAASSTGVI